MKVALITFKDIDKLTGGYIYNQKVVSYLRQQGITVDIIGLKRLPYFANIIWNIWLFFHLTKKHYDLVIEDELCHISVFILNHILKRQGRTRIAVIVHLLHWLEIVRWQLSSIIVKWIEKKMLLAADLIIANSNYTKKEITRMGVPEKTVEIVYPGYDPPFKLSKVNRKERSKGITKILFVGSCLPHKGLKYLIEAVYRLKDPNIHLDIVGDTTLNKAYTKIIKRIIKKYGLEEMIFFHGVIPRKAIWHFYVDADIFAVPSLYEAYGIVFVEAMFFKLPVIATNAGGIPEIVENEKTGLLIPPKNIAALSEAIEKLVKKEELRIIYGEQGFARLKNFSSWEKTGQTIYKLLHRLWLVKSPPGKKQKLKRIPKR